MDYQLNLGIQTASCTGNSNLLNCRSNNGASSGTNAFLCHVSISFIEQIFKSHVYCIQDWQALKIQLINLRKVLDAFHRGGNNVYIFIYKFNLRFLWIFWSPSMNPKLIISKFENRVWASGPDRPGLDYWLQ